MCSTGCASCPMTASGVCPWSIPRTASRRLFTQGDFVSYTWPDLFMQARGLAKATVIGKFHYFLIGGGILIYVLAMIVVLSAV